MNFAKSFDFENIARYVTELKEIPEIADSIQIEEEKKKAYLGLEEAWNPYRLVLTGLRMKSGVSNVSDEGTDIFLGLSK